MLGFAIEQRRTALTDARKKVLGAALFFCILESLFAGLIVLAMRWPLGSTPFGIAADDVLRAVGFSAAVMAMLACLLTLPWRAWLTAIVPLALGCGLLWIGSTVPLLGDSILGLLLASALILGARAGLHRFGGGFAGMLCLILLAGLLALAQVTVLVYYDAGAPQAFERALAGIQLPDTLFHATLAGIDGRYGVVSHGFDGLAPFNYHTLSHTLFQQFADWSDLPTIMAYSVFSPVVCFPVMIFSLLAIVSTGGRTTWPQFDPIVALCTVVMIMMMVSLATLLSFWGSENAMVAQWFMLLALVVVGLVVRDGTRWEDVPTAVLLALLVFLAAKAKISSGAILGAGLGIWYVLMSGWRLRGFVYGAAVAALPFLFVFLSTFSERVQSGSFGFGMFGFLYVFGFAPILILVVGGLIYALRRMFRADGPLTGGEGAFRWMIVAMLALSVVSAAILRLPGVAELYFIGPGIWACFAYFMRDGRVGLFLAKRSVNWRLAVILALALVPVLGKGTVHRGAKVTADGTEKMAVFSQPVTTAGLLSATTLGQIFSAVRSDPSIDAVNVAPDVDTVWAGRDPCWVASLAIPALTARPMIAGLPPAADACKLSPYYGFASYDPAQSSAVPLTDEALCQRVQGHGLVRVLRVTKQELRVLDCSAL